MKKYTKLVVAVLAAGAINDQTFAEETVLGVSKMEDMMRSSLNMAPREVMQKIKERGLDEKKSLTPQVLDVNGQGQVRLRGTVTSVSNTSFSIKTWGGIWTILPGVNPEFISADKSLASFAVGDYVGVQGVIVPDISLTIQGNIIRNRSWRPEAVVTRPTDGVREINPQNTISPKKLLPIVSNMPTPATLESSPVKSSAGSKEINREINPQNTISPKKLTPAPLPGGAGIMVEGSLPPANQPAAPGVIIVPVSY